MMPQSLWPSNPVDLLWCALLTIVATIIVTVLMREIDKRPRELKRIWRFVRTILLLLLPALFFPALSLLPYEFALVVMVVVLGVAILWVSWVVTKDP